MSSIVHCKDNRTGITYCYESESYWDKDAKMPKSHRKLIGKLDENGNIVPTGPRGRRKKTTEDKTEDKVKASTTTSKDAMPEKTSASLGSEVKDLQIQLAEERKRNSSLQQQLDEVRKEKEQLQSLLTSALKIVSQ